MEDTSAKTAADLKKGASAKGKESGYGHILLSFIFRPAEPPAAAAQFRADLGNREFVGLDFVCVW